MLGTGMCLPTPVSLGEGQQTDGGVDGGVRGGRREGVSVGQEFVSSNLSQSGEEEVDGGNKSHPWS